MAYVVFMSLMHVIGVKMERLNGKFTFGDLKVVLWCGWWYGTLSIHCTKYSLRVT